MKLKQNKKKIIIILSLLLIILLAFGTFKGYQSFRYDQRQTAIDMESMMELFNMQLRVPDKEKPGDWIYLQPLQLQEDSSFDIKLFPRYMLKKVTFQEIQYKDVEPQWSLLPTEKDPKFPNTKSTAECLENFNNNLLYNPQYEQYKMDAEFNKPFAMNDLLNDPKKVVKLKDDLLYYSRREGFSWDVLANNPCPSQYLPK